MEYHINGSSMHSLMKEHITMLKLKGKKQSKKTDTEVVELQRYIDFMERKCHATFHGVARFCLVTIGLTTTSFSAWDNNASKVEVWDDRKGCPFGFIGFQCILGCA